MHSEGSATIDEVPPPGDHAADARAGRVLAPWERVRSSANYSVFYGQ
jgi:hypothetical protein